jgi:hypothetical protein
VSPRCHDSGAVAPEIFESKVSVRPLHKTDMMDNHYKTSMLVK